MMAVHQARRATRLTGAGHGEPQGRENHSPEPGLQDPAALLFRKKSSLPQLFLKRCLSLSGLLSPETDWKAALPHAQATACLHLSLVQRPYPAFSFPFCPWSRSHSHIPTGSFRGPKPTDCADPRRQSGRWGWEAHLGEHGHHAAQALSALLLQSLLLVCPGLQPEALQVVNVFQEDVEVLGLVGSLRFFHDLYMVDCFLPGKRGEAI